MPVILFSAHVAGLVRAERRLLRSQQQAGRRVLALLLDHETSPVIRLEGIASSYTYAEATWTQSLPALGRQ